MKKTLLCNLLCVLFSILLVFETFGAKEEIGGQEAVALKKDSYNIMLLIDKSGSMNKTDKNRMALSAADQFVEQLCTYYGDLSIVTSVGVMSFSQDTKVISQPLCLDSEENTNYLKSTINNIEYDRENTGGTDLGTALYEAAQILEKKSSEEPSSKKPKSIIVLFTDGYSEKMRDKTVSEKNREEALNIAEKLSCEIYIVGLNQDNRIKENGRKEIYFIADEAQIGDGVAETAEDDEYTEKERVNYLITDNINDVRGFYAQIYAKMGVGKIIYVNNNEFKILTQSLLEADVIIGSNTPITGISVMDPNGDKLEEDGKTFFVNGDSYYKVIRIMRPETGTWTVNAETQDKSYIIYVVEFYGVRPVITTSWGRNEEAEYKDSGLEEPLIGKTEVALMYKTEPYQEKHLIEELTITEFAVTDSESGEEVGVYSLSYDFEEGKYTGYFPVEENKNYKLVVTLQNEDKTMNMVKEDQLKVYPPEPAETTPTETTSSENTIVDPIPPAPAPGRVISIPYVIGFLMLVLLLLSGGLALIRTLFIRIIGSFEVFIELDNASDSEYRGESIEREIESYPYGKAFSIWKLVEKIINECQSSESEAEKEICSILLKEKTEISKKKLVISNLNNNRNAKKHQVYKLQDNNHYFYDLTNLRTCYQSQELIIKITFKGIDIEEETSGNFASLSDIPKTGHRK